MKMKELPPCDFDFLAKQTRLIVSCYGRLTGKKLCRDDQSDDALVREIFFAPFVVASAGNESDPVLNYGNQKALELWELDWNAFTRTPGRHTAEAMERAAREEFLQKVKKSGYVDDYQGVRISSKGRRFEIQKATVWNLLDPAGDYAGQAVTFGEVRYL